MAPQVNASGPRRRGFAVLRDGSLPVPESPARKALIHGVALLAIAVTAVYLVWRVTSTIDLGWWWVAFPLLLVELHNAFGLVLYTVAVWDVDPGTTPADADSTSWRVAILIPTYNESVEILLPTIAAAVALKPGHETWVLDDGRRDDVRRLAERLGARYLTRPDNAHAKAGNLNHALGIVQADIVGVLDADHVPTERFLTATLPYFEDKGLAFVQTPQDFYNLESFEHERMRGGQMFNEEAVFYRVIAAAKNRWSAPFWCGTCALIRVDALHSVGGVATDSLTEDIETTIRMFRKGWHGIYHNEVLARGLAPDDAASYMVQRHRWAVGAMQVLRREDPLFGTGLTFGQRLAFMTTLFGWFDSWRTLAYMVIPLAVVATGAVPISAPGEVFGPLFLATLGLQFIALRLLARGRYPPILSLLFEVLRMPAVLPATLALLHPGRETRFQVTPKGRHEGGRKRIAVPRLLSVLAGAGSLGLVWFTASIAGLTPVTYSVPWAAIGAAIFMAGNLALVLAAIGRIRSSRFAGNRRASVRLTVDLPATLNGRPCEVHDLSVSGARVTVHGPIEAGAARLTLTLDGEELDIPCAVRRRRIDAGRDRDVGLEFAPGQEMAIARLAVALFHPALPAEAPADDKPSLLWKRSAA